MVQQAPGYALADPLGGVCRKPEIPGIVKFSGRRQQADGALLYEIHQRHAPAGVLPGNGHHQPEIAVDHPADGLLIPLGAALGQCPLLLRGQPGKKADLPEILPDVILVRGDVEIRILFFIQKLCHALIPFLSRSFCWSSKRSSSELAV